MPCAHGARRWGSRPSSAPADGCFRKPSRPRRLLRAWLRRLDCDRACNSRCVIAGPAGTTTAISRFETPDGPRTVEARATVLALGGASWPRLGSDGAWVETLAAKGVGDIAAAAGQLRLHRRLVRHFPRPLRGPAAERRRAVVWRAQRARRSHDHAHRHRRRRDLCAVGRLARGDRSASGQATLHIALRPDLDTRAISPRGCPRREAKQSFSNWLRKAAHLSPVAIGLLQEAAIASGVSLSSLSAGRPRRLDQRGADRTHRRRADRARDLDRAAAPAPAPCRALPSRSWSRPPPAPKPPSSSENGSPSRPCSASLPQTRLAPAALLRHVFLARVEIVGIGQQTVDAFLEKPLLLGQIKIHFVSSYSSIINSACHSGMRPLGAGPESISRRGDRVARSALRMPRVCSPPLTPTLSRKSGARESNHKPQHRLGDDVALDLVRAAVDRDLAVVEIARRDLRESSPIGLVAAVVAMLVDRARRTGRSLPSAVRWWPAGFPSP